MSTPAPAGKRRVFKKESYDEKIALYMPVRDVIEDAGLTDVVEAVVFVHDDLKQDPSVKVFARLACDFKYDSEDWEALGVEFERSLYDKVVQVYPPISQPLPSDMSSFQRKMIRKVGEKNAFAVTMELPSGLPTSVMLVPLSHTLADPSTIKRNCGVFYSLVCFPGATAEDRPHKKTTARFALRKHTVIPPPTGDVPAPSAITDKKTMLNNDVVLFAALSKSTYSHGETVNVQIKVTNDANRNITGVKLELMQIIDVRVSDHATPLGERTTVCSVESTEGFPVSKGKELELSFKLPVRLPDKVEKGYSAQVAVDGVLKHDTVNLAPSTRLTHSQMDNNVGLIVSYLVAVKCNRRMGSKLAVEVPFTLTYPTVPTAMRQLSMQQRRSSGAAIAPPSAEDEFDDYEEVGLSEEFAKFMMKRSAAHDE